MVGFSSSTKPSATPVGCETVPARVVSSEPAADLSLLKLDRVPADAKMAPLADSDTVLVGDQVFIVGFAVGFAAIAQTQDETRFVTAAVNMLVRYHESTEPPGTKRKRR